MAVGYLRPTKGVVNCQAIYNNIKAEQQHIKNNAEIYAVVKANGYGHGAVKVAEVAKKAGATGFCVSILDEALELREAGFKEPILILGVVDPRYVYHVIKEELSCAAISLEWLEAVLKEWPKEEIGKLAIHVKIDTGMGRLGLRTEKEMTEVLEFLKKHPQFYLEGLFTHFSKADSADEEHFKLQQDRFSKAVSIFPKDIPYIHTSNSATALWHDNWQSNLIRLGASMYGINPSGKELDTPYEIEQAMSVITEIVQVKQVPKGEAISYGATYYTSEEEWIGTLPIGYADGFTRAFQDFEVLVDGKRCPIVGRVCMDQCMIKLPNSYPVGTKVVIFGHDRKGNSISFQEAAEYIGTINYEIPCVLSERVPLVYVNECD